MPYASRIALLISCLSVLAAYWVSENIYERTPHVEDEFAYVWQAQVFAHGQAYITSPAHPTLFVVPFVVDHDGIRFSKYPPGWSLVLSLGILTGLTAWINPLLAGLAVWLTFRLGQKIFDDRTALLTISLLATSPFFLMVSGTLLSHPWSLFLSLALTLAWLDLFIQNDDPPQERLTPEWIKICIAGLSLGVLALTRPLTAIGVGLPFFIHGLILLWRGNLANRKTVLIIGGIAAAAASIQILWQYILTGNPMQNLYALWWEYDRIGFGDGIGTQPGGHGSFWVINNLVSSMMAGSRDLFGWGSVSWLFIPFGLWAARRNRSVELLIGIPAGLIVIYTAYWVSPNLYGPRYYYEGITLACLLTSAGILWLSDRCKRSSLPNATVPVLAILLVSYNLLGYLPARMDTMRNLYAINRDQLSPFLTDEAASLTPALVIVHAQEWTECAGLLPLQDPWLNTPFIFACDMDHSSETIRQEEFPERKLVHYYPDTREILLTAKE